MSVFGDAFSVGAVQVVLQGFKGGLAKQGETNHTSFQVWYPNRKPINLKLLTVLWIPSQIPDPDFSIPDPGVKKPRIMIRIVNTDLTNN
jgi:hypothetical protein